MVYLPYRFALLFLCLTAGYVRAQTPTTLSESQPPATLPNAPSAFLSGAAPTPSPVLATANSAPCTDDTSSSSSAYSDSTDSSFGASQQPKPSQTPDDGSVDANGKPIPLSRREPHRLLGFMPNFRTVAAGAAVHPPGWKYNFTSATDQALDYSSFIFLGITSLTAEGMNSHPVLGKGADGFYAYTWRGFIDKSDQTYLSAWLLPSLLHEDTRYYPLGDGHPILERALYVIGSQAIARSYTGHDTPAFASLGGKAIAQYISTSYYPDGSEPFSVLATKFSYSVMRDIAFSAIREFYPDVAAHYIRKHRQKAARQAARDAQAAQKQEVGSGK